jgi:hypothetical protein
MSTIVELHIAVIGQVLFTLTFGLIALVLSIGGLCTTSLPKKVYYYHSAGEIHIICGMIAPLLSPSLSLSLSLRFHCIYSCSLESTRARDRSPAYYFPKQTLTYMTQAVCQVFGDRQRNE